MPDTRRKLQDLLIELFQFNDSADLDFGIYRIMNHKAAEITAFIEHDLLDAVASGLQLITDAQREQAETAYRDAKAALEAEVGEDFVALDPAGNLTEEALAARGGTMRRVREAYQNAKADVDAARQSADLEARVYNDLYRFFARYYDDGDFISQRRYGATDKYAIPYNGEEVSLYWANFDQYYVKSGETFTDYRFQLPEGIGFAGASVAFKLRAASVAQNNVKGEKRFFVLAGEEPVTWDEGARRLTIGFEYRLLTEEEKKWAGGQKQQERLNADAEKAILARVAEPLVRERLSAPEGEKGQERTFLARHLARYTARNTRDYFIHKNLRRFLERELDFYLKSEVLRLEDLDWKQPGLVRMTAARLETIRLIAGRIIAFLSQIEEFQKRLWEKRKFVVQSDWCITLDRAPEELYAEIAANERQRAEWVRLYALEEGEQPGFFGADGPAGAVEFLRQHQTMMVDTAFFDEDFKGRLLTSIEDLASECLGLVVHSENYQALQLLTPQYRGRVQSVYIDPPYNTGDGDFPYKDAFYHSSWLAMLSDRLTLGRELQAETGVLVVSIDDAEVPRLTTLLDLVYGEGNALAVLVYDRNRKNDATFFSVGHEYMLAYAKDRQLLTQRGIEFREPKEGIDNARKLFARLRKQHGEDWEAIRKAWLAWFDTMLGSDPRRRLARYSKVGPRGPYRDDGNMNWPGGNGPRYDVHHPITGKLAKVPVSGWRYPTAERFWEEYHKGKILFGPDETTVPTTISYLFEGDGQVMPSVFYSYAQTASQEFDALYGKRVFDNPKNWRDLARLFAYFADSRAAVLDFFAGSGSTAHAVMALNQRDQGTRRYVLVEMADYVDTVLLPRIKKIAYAADWRDGKPVAGSAGQSHMFQYLRLESYEDALNNVRFRETEPGLLATLHAMPDYMLHYMLDYETAGSPGLLDLAQFDHPFDYKLNITHHDATEPHTVDLVTTFNFLLGLRIRTYRRLERDGRPVVRVTGEDGRGRRVCVLWRDVPELDEMEAEKVWLQEQALHGVAYDLLYVNGESALPDALPIEPEFQRLMFEPVTGKVG